MQLEKSKNEGMKMLQLFVNGTLTEGNNRDFTAQLHDPN
jgi:hypothetical protein